MIRAIIPEAEQIYLFGSYAKGTAHQESDIDLAVLLPKPVKWQDRKIILNKLYRSAGEKGYRVDILIKTTEDFESAKNLPCLSRAIAREGILL